MCQSPSYFLGCHLLIYLCNTNFSDTGQDQWIPKALLFLKVNVCSGYSLEAALSNVNDSFTLSRLMKRSKTFCYPARDEYSQITFFREIYRKRFNNLQAYSTSNSDIIQMLFDRITCYNFQSCEQCRI